MKLTMILAVALALFIGCAGEGEDYADTESAPAFALDVEAPEPLPMPERRTLESDTDWEGKVHNKDIEIIEVLNIINPVAAYITEGFKQYGDRFGEGLHEEWEDTQVHLTKALSLYDSCKKRREAGSFDKQLFLDMEEVWQLLVKTGVAGVRTKNMIDSELSAMAN